MTKMVTIPKSEYDHLRALEEDLADIQTALTIEARIASGEEELVPASVVERLINGDPPLRVWREFRDLSQAALARATGVNRVQIVEIEAGRNSGFGSHPAQNWPMLLGLPWMTSSLHLTTRPVPETL